MVSAIFIGAASAAEYMKELLYEETTDVSSFLVVVIVWDVSRQTKVSNLQHVVISNQNIPRRQITMYALYTYQPITIAMFLTQLHANTKEHLA